SSLIFVRLCRPPTTPLLPYTTLFRSRSAHSQSSHSCGQRLSGAVCASDSRTGEHYDGGRRAYYRACACERNCHVRGCRPGFHRTDRKSTRLNSSHVKISYAVFCLKKK